MTHFVCKTLDLRLDLADLHQLNPARYPFLLESVSRGPAHARFSILFACPQQRLISSSRGVVDESGCHVADDFLSCLDHAWQTSRVVSCCNEDLPFTGGWFVYLGYELANEIEPTLKLASSDLPLAEAVRIPCAVVIDHAKGVTTLMAEQEFAHNLTDIQADCDKVAGRVYDTPHRNLLASLEEEAGDDYLHAVERIKRYIIDGDVFQVNLSRAWHGELRDDADAVMVYRQLRNKNPAPFAGLAQLSQACIVSSSPERLVRARAGMVDTRPIAGTRPRGSGGQQDRDYGHELLAHPKERAEHIMLIDLERNDLGRVCLSGTVEVNELMVLESYAHVHHIVSNVRGQLRPEVTPGQVIRAVFPGGTITGCPKVRCMEIIAELEQVPRGIYTGSMGYLNRTGDMDLNILIRSVCLRGKQLTLRTGAGIVADSIAVNELEETRAKAKGLMLGLGVAI